MHYDERMRALIHNAIIVAIKGLTALIVIIVAGNIFWDKYLLKDGHYYDNPNCNIAVIPIEGGISTIPDASFPAAADRVLADLRLAENDPLTEGILVRIDSPGGTIVATEMIANAIKRAKKPVVALIREIGTSGGYLVATGADTIIASSVSIVGSIGVTSSYVETAGKLKEDGSRFIEIVSAPFKEVGNPDRPLSEQEKELLVREIKETHEEFVAQVAQNRGLPFEKVAAIADGTTVSGKRALELGLVDTLGDQETARAWFDNELGKSSDFCEPPPPLPAPSSEEESY